MNILQLESLTVSIGGGVVCQDLNLEIAAGQLVGILGRNGVGKTTLLYTIMQFHPVDAGRIALCGNAAANLSRKQIARHVGILFQESDLSLPCTVMEYAMLGRYPNSRSLFREAAEDVDAVNQALLEMGLKNLADRQVASLSGGERQRLAMAALLAQSPDLYLLDEPSNHLDIDFQLRTLNLLHQQMQTQPAALIMATHDINLAARYCDSILLLTGGGSSMWGPASEILVTENLSAAFDCEIVSVDRNERRYFFPA